MYYIGLHHWLRHVGAHILCALFFGRQGLLSLELPYSATARNHRLCHSVASVNGAPWSCAVKDSGALCDDLDIAHERGHSLLGNSFTRRLLVPAVRVCGHLRGSPEEREMVTFPREVRVSGKVSQRRPAPAES